MFEYQGGGSTWREREGGRVCAWWSWRQGLQCAPHLSAHYLVTECGYSQSRPLPHLRKSLAYLDSGWGWGRVAAREGWAWREGKEGGEYKGEGC